ncbi:MAG: putative bifunctional diguanylate cyclase/phosphodiesterase [Candidatus Dormibacteria bacterium]
MVARARPEATGRQMAPLRAAVLGPDLSEHELLSAVVAQSPVALTVVDPAGIAMLWNPASEGVFGWSAQEVIGHRLPTIDPVSEVEHDEIRTRTLNGAHVLDHETQRRHRDGRLIDVAISTVPLRDPGGRTVAVLGIFRDITKRKGVEAELIRQAQHDELTGLLNRRGLTEKMGGLAAHREGVHGAIAVLNLARLKEVNDSQGLAAGDEVLRIFAKRLARAVRPSDVVARLDGDTFAVAMPRIPASHVEAAVARVIDRLGSHYRVGGRELDVDVAAGAAVCSDCDAPEEALRRAAVALHQAKLQAHGRLYVLQAEDDRAFVERIELAEQLSGAAERGELRLHFQPIVCVASGLVCGAEALVRWEHPERGLLGPNQFIPLAEETGSISKIGCWVLDEACRALAGWVAADPASAEMSVSVNLSVAQLLDPDLVPHVAEAAANCGLAPDHLHLEITESVLSTDPEAAAKVLEELHSLGVVLAIDDFGTGNSSLTALRRFPFQVLKVDQSFVSGIGVRPDDETIVAATIGLAHGLGLTVVAEGVETEAQREFLVQHGCDELQGYLLGRPEPRLAAPATEGCAPA